MKCLVEIMVKSLGGIVFLVAVTSGCTRGTDALLEKAALEAAVGAQKQISAQNENLGAKAREMEADLATRQRFFQGVQGVYEGSIKTENGDFSVRITLIPSIPRYHVQRTRTLEEVAADISNLHFNIQIVQWNASNSMSAVGCRVEAVHPDLAEGRIAIASENCQNVYLLELADQERDPSESAAGIASDLLDGRRSSVLQLVGRVQPSTNAQVYSLSATRVNR